MDEPTSDSVVAIISKVADYGSAIASVVTNHLITAKRIPEGLEGAVNIIYATVATLQQVSAHLKADTGMLDGQKEKKPLSRDGVDYVRLLATECAVAFVKIVPIAIDAGLTRKELREKRKLERKSLAKKRHLGLDNDIDIESLSLDTVAFAEAVETANRADLHYVMAGFKAVMARLHEIQLHLLLVHQVVSLGQLSRTGPSNQVDIKSVIAFHERVLRTASIIGIEAPDQQTTRIRHPRNRSDSDSDSDSSTSYSTSDSDSDFSDRKRKRSKKSLRRFGSPPPMPCPRAQGFGMRGVGESGPMGHPRIPQGPPPPVVLPNWMSAPPSSMTSQPTIPAPISPVPIVVPGAVQPPAYSEAQRLPPSMQSPVTCSTTLHPIVTGPSKSAIPESRSISLNESDLTPSEKAEKSDAKDEVVEVEAITIPVALEPRLFKSKTNSLSFKFKSLFRSKESLGEEMKKALEDSESILRAFVIRGHETRLVPHSTFHTLEATHMQTILSQINDNTWYKTFSTLRVTEQQSMDRLLNPSALGKTRGRNLVVLKIIEEKKPNAWIVLLREMLKKYPAPFGFNDRVILAIMREKLVDGKPLPVGQNYRNMPPPPPPPFGFGPPPRAPGPRPGEVPFIPVVRPPPGIMPNGRRYETISDLGMPPQLPLHPPRVPLPPPGAGPPGPPSGPLPPHFANFNNCGPIRLSDTRPFTEYDAILALTTYKTYTLRLIPLQHPNMPVTWERASVTEERSDESLIRQRIASFNQKGPGNVIEAKLRLNEHQNRQLTRLMDEIYSSERDPLRFEWCWAEISLYDEVRELAFVSQANSARANTMHVIAKRSLKASCDPIQVHRALWRSPPPPPPMGSALTPALGHGMPPTLQQPRPPQHQMQQRPILRMPPPPPSRGARVMRRSASPARKLRQRRRSRYVSDSSDSDSDVSTSDSGDEECMRTVLRKERMQKINRKKAIRDCKGSESDSSGSESEEDVIQVKLDLKRGDDVVTALLNLWTPQAE